MNYSELLQLAKGWSNFKFYRVIIWRLLKKSVFCGIVSVLFVRSQKSVLTDSPSIFQYFDWKISAHKGFFVQWSLRLQFVQTVCTNSILLPFLHYPAVEDKTLPFEFQSPLSVLLLSAGIICTWKQIIVHCHA